MEYERWGHIDQQTLKPDDDYVLPQ